LKSREGRLYLLSLAHLRPRRVVPAEGNEKRAAGGSPGWEPPL
jgi:hypothetical protein